MAKKSRPTIKKRQREMARLQKQQDKLARRLAAKDRPEESPRDAGGEDPDIAGIRPGPQPIELD